MRHPGGDDGQGPADEPFLQRWSRRKRGLAEVEDPPAEVAAEEPPAADPAPALTDTDMPDLDTIGADSDISPFFSSGVSEELRQAALKRLFRTPKFNLRDGLDDYDEDYRSFHALGDIVTAEMRRQRERAEARLREQMERGAQNEPSATELARAPQQRSATEPAEDHDHERRDEDPEA